MRNPLDCRYVKNPVLWMHDLMFGAPELEEAREVLRDVNPPIVGVSEFHKKHLEEFFPGQRITRIFNPVDEVWALEVRKVHDDRKVLFTSSPHKGFDKTLGTFMELVQRDPSFRFYYCNPGYWSGPHIQTKRIHDLGSIPHPNVLKHVQSSLCMLQVNDVFSETFGIVYAEANAVGTPVLTYDLGAAKEVLAQDGRQVLPLGSPTSAFVDRIIEFSTDRPKVKLDPRFALSRIADEWKALLRAEGDNHARHKDGLRPAGCHGTRP